MLEHPSAPQIRALLGLVYEAFLEGDQNQAGRLSLAARTLADSLQLPRVYISYHKQCPIVQERLFLDTAQLLEFCRGTPEEEVASCKTGVKTGVTPFDPSQHIVIGHIATGGLTDRGGYVLVPDWSDIHEASKL